jgi:parallel beta-helix repeat protein
VDNEASTDGDGSLDTPWNNIAGHVDDLAPGDTMCVRGNPSAPGRVYTEPVIYLHRDAGTPSGTDEAPITARTYPGEHVVLHCAEVADYPFELKGVRHWHFDGFVFDAEVILAQKRNARAIGIYAGANYNVIRNCEIRNGRLYGIDIASSSHNLIENCEIHDFITGSGQDSHGIILTGGEGNIFRDNVIYDITGDGIRLWPGNASGPDTGRLFRKCY